MSIQVKDSSYNIDKYPDTCPACGKGISPVYCYGYSSRDSRSYDYFLQIVLRCPREECNRLFVAIYTEPSYRSYNDELYLNRTLIIDSVDFENFPDSINNISPLFSKIFNQSKVAEENKLLLIAGPGYRKSLEFLVKDYLIQSEPDKSDQIKKEFLGDTIKRIKNKNIEACASRAAWLGNDESHYLRKWNDKDLQDLKNLIKMVVDWIDLIQRSSMYEDAMPSPESPKKV